MQWKTVRISRRSGCGSKVRRIQSSLPNRHSIPPSRFQAATARGCTAPTAISSGPRCAITAANIPIFNRRATRNNIRSAQLSARSQRLALTEAELALRKEIEQAWYNADAAYSKYRSAGVALASAEVAFAYEQQKADAGRSTVFDFNDAKTRMEKAESELVQAKYEFVFRSKILDFYRGRPLEL